MDRIALALAGLLTAVVLGGCANNAADPNAALDKIATNAPTLEVTDSTGGIRGVVVDSAITPIAGATVAITNGPTAKTDKSGLFTFSGLKPGDYFLTASKAGYTTVQSTAVVKAGVANPPIVKIQVAYIPGKQPYVETFKLNGFYECGFSFGDPEPLPATPIGRAVITDQCDFGVRTAYDAANGTAPAYPAPRNVMQGKNTQYFDVASDVQTVVQEAFWSDSTVPNMMITLSSTPIDNACDCSKSDYILVYQPSPTYARMDADKDNATMPLGLHVASRGFLNWETISTAQNLQFTILTTLFHNYKAADGWTFATQDQYPIG